MQSTKVCIPIFFLRFHMVFYIHPDEMVRDVRFFGLNNLPQWFPFFLKEVP